MPSGSKLGFTAPKYKMKAPSVVSNYDADNVAIKSQDESKGSQSNGGQSSSQGKY